MRPVYQVKADRNDITDRIAKRLISLRLTDKAGYESDTVEIAIDDSDHGLEMPRRGVELEISIGYENALSPMGKYRVDEIEVSGPQDGIVIRGKAVDMGQQNAAMKQPRNRAWKAKTIGQIVETIAKEAGYTAKVAPHLAKIQLGAWHQTDDSNLHFLTRLARQNGAIVKVSGGYLLFVEEGVGKTASDKPLQPVEIRVSQVTDWRVLFADRDAYTSVTTFYHDQASGEDVGVRVGQQDGPNRRIRRRYANRDDAERSAQATLDAQKKDQAQLSITMPGDPKFNAERPLKLIGWRQGVPEDWIISSVEHVIDGNGYQCRLEGITEKEDK